MGSTRRRFGIGIALVSVIPLLAVLCITMAGTEEPSPFSPLYLLVIGLIVLVAAIGFTLLWEHPLHLRRIKDTMRQLAAPTPQAVGPAAEEAGDDMAEIERYMDMIVERLRDSANAAEAERQRLQQQILRTQKVESISIMATAISHDFNNHLAAILGNASIVLNALPEAAPGREHVRHIELTALKAFEFTNLIHIYTGQEQLTADVVNLSTMVTQMDNLLKLATPRGATVECHLDPALPSFVGDASDIRLVILNLFTNAAEALPDGKGTITVTTGCMHCDRAYLKDAFLDENRPEGRHVFIEVADTGEGIGEDVREKMFDPFFSTKIRGRGLGLAVVLGVARSHGGSVKVTSEPGKGSTFRVLIPCVGTGVQNGAQNRLADASPLG